MHGKLDLKLTAPVVLHGLTNADFRKQRNKTTTLLGRH